MTVWGEAIHYMYVCRAMGIHEYGGFAQQGPDAGHEIVVGGG